MLGKINVGDEMLNIIHIFEVDEIIDVTQTSIT